MMGPPFRYDLLIFDLDGVLLDFSAAEVAALESAFQVVGIPFESGWLDQYRTVNGRFWKAFERGAMTPDQIKKERFPAFLKEIGVSADPVAMSRDYLTALSRSAMLLGDPLPVLNDLRGKVPMALITNGLKAVQHPRLDAAGIRPFFSPIVISEEVGVAKPDPAIFQLVLDAYHPVDRERVLMIGDSLSSDIAGARATGIHSCWLRPEEARNSVADMVPDHEISDLEQLFDVLSD